MNWSEDIADFGANIREILNVFDICFSEENMMKCAVFLAVLGLIAGNRKDYYNLVIFVIEGINNKNEEKK